MLQLQPVDEHRRHAAALVGKRRLLLHDRGKRDQLRRSLDRQVRSAPAPHIGEHPVALALHAIDDVLACVAARELVGLGQQAALRRDRLDFAGEHLVRVQAIDDLLAGEPFRNCHRIENALAGHHGVHDVAHAGMGGDQIFAGLEAGGLVAQPHAEDEQPFGVDDAVLDQFVGDRADAGAMRDGEGARRVERAGTVELRLGEEDAATDGEDADDDDGDDEIEEHHHGMADGARARRRRRHRLGLKRLRRAARRGAAERGMKPRRQRLSVVVVRLSPHFNHGLRLSLAPRDDPGS